MCHVSDAGALEHGGAQWQPIISQPFKFTNTINLSVCSSQYILCTPKDNAAIHRTKFKLMLVRPILHLSHIFTALIATRKYTTECNILVCSSFPWRRHRRSIAVTDIFWGILRYPCRLYCFMCHQVITPSIVTTYDISCLAWLPSGSLVLPGAVQHNPDPALWKPTSL